MFGWFRRLFKRKEDPNLTEEEEERYYEAKVAALERVLGPMGQVGHAAIPFFLGGAVDMYCFPQADGGTAFATMELLTQGSGPKRSRIGTYELVAFTRHSTDESDREAFTKAASHLRTVMTSVAMYAFSARLNPNETAAIPWGEGEDNACLVFDEWAPGGARLEIDGRTHGLLLIMQIFGQEMEYAKRCGGAKLIENLKRSGYYPYSDLDRRPVA